jgi:alpha-1,3/alpha-1,6-mannosyltransferase
MNHASGRPLRIAFLHPTLRHGGAERLVVDAAVELQQRGHAVALFTASRDRTLSFPETQDGSLDVRVRGAFIPAQVRGRFLAPCTIARLAWIAARAATARQQFDAIVCDLIPYPLPLLRALAPLRARGGARPKLVYYCHYPDQLLAPARQGWYGLYRAPLDRLEVPAMHAADLVLTNSAFTAGKLTGLGAASPRVVYPGVDVASYAGIPELRGDEVTLLVVGRLDPRKNLPLAVEALARLRVVAPAAFAQATLVVAGGFDRERGEGDDLGRQLQALAQKLGVADKLVLRASPTDPERRALLARCLCVVHCAPEEHFGLVPVEAMAAARPIIAVANAGPLETIVHGETGFLCPPTPDAFATAVAALFADRARAAQMGRAGRAHATARFSRRAFGDALEAALVQLCGTAR